MQTIKAIYDGINFKPIQPIPVNINEKYEVFITFIEPVKKDFTDTTKIVKRPRSEFIGLFICQELNINNCR